MPESGQPSASVLHQMIIDIVRELDDRQLPQPTSSSGQVGVTGADGMQGTPFVER